MTHLFGKFAAIMLAVAFTAVAGSAQLAERKTLTLAVAKQIAAASEAEAMNHKFNMVIAIVDDGNNLLYLERMDDSQLASIRIAQGKAHTALAFKRPTKALEDAVAGGRNAIMTLPGGVLVQGGLPLFTPDGKIIGAIGVSGGTSPEDAMVAQAGVDAFAKLLAH
ncbi:MAG TPA: heme-binding protein [Candidatus Dormibacteraeota bacterium]|nr:heme-binding protein [Candidatus Dormibacteraeota bacterium]